MYKQIIRGICCPRFFVGLMLAWWPSIVFSVSIVAAADVIGATSPAGTKTVADKRKNGVLLTEGLGLKGKGQQSDEPLEIKSKSLDLDAGARVFTYRGDVVVTQGDLTIVSDLMVGRYDDQNRIQTVTCEKNVVITRGPSLRATSNRATYFVPKGVIELTEGPELFRDSNALSADKVTIFVNEDRSEAEGNVQVKVVKGAASGAAAKSVEAAGGSVPAARAQSAAGSGDSVAETDEDDAGDFVRGDTGVGQ